MATTKEVFPSDAILWLEFGGQYVNSAGLTVIDNLATMGNAVKTVLCGDGTTAITIPAQIVGKRGLNFAESQYVDTGIVDPFERTDKFSIFVFYSSYSSINAFILGTTDAAQSNKGIGFYFHGTIPNNFSRTFVFASVWDTNMIYTSDYCSQKPIYSWCVTSSGSSGAAGIKTYSNGVNSPQTTQVNALTTSVKNGKPFLLAARHNGSSKTSNSGCNIHFAAIFPSELTPLQVSNLHKKVIKRINIA